MTRDRVDKRTLYAEVGVAHYWIVDPDARTLEVHTLGSELWILSGSFDETACVRVPPFEEIELAVGRLFLPRARAPK